MSLPFDQIGHGHKTTNGHKKIPFRLIRPGPLCIDSLNMAHLSPPAMQSRTSTSPAPVLTVTPARGLVDDPISIKAGFMPPNHPVTLCAQMRSENGDPWEAFGHYNTSADGTVNRE